jgi:MoxR-like ATPase
MNTLREGKPDSVGAVQHGLKDIGYICTKEIATAVYLASHMAKPILIEGPAGVGKTELAKSVSLFMNLPLIRLQCYEGLDESKALYEWKYGKQLLYTQMLKERVDKIIVNAEDLDQSIRRLHQYNDVFFSLDFLEPRPLLKALQHEQGAVLLIDEVDKSDQEFEAFLLEVLSDFQVTIPELGTITAVSKPLVFLTSNNTRELSEALKRRCLYLFIAYPDFELEREIIRSRVPGISEKLGTQLVSFIQRVRVLDLRKAPSVSETIDWAKVLLLLHIEELTPEVVKENLNIILKFEEDIRAVKERVHEIIGGSGRGSL